LLKWPIQNNLFVAPVCISERISGAKIENEDAWNSTVWTRKKFIASSRKMQTGATRLQQGKRQISRK
jgi:hypothetical protein